MKTKIIYISGNEIFDMQDIRAAFEEVRTALNLGTDTVLFGVPVDSDSAIAAPLATATMAGAVESAVSPAVEPEPVPAEEPAATEIEAVIEPEPEPEAEPEVEPEPAAEPAPKKRRAGRPKKKAPVDDPVATASDDAPTDDAAPVVDAPTDTPDKVIPILSVLAAQQSMASDAAADAPMDTPHDTEDAGNDDVDTIESDDVDDETVVERVTIEDMISDEAPVPDVEKTLEQLLEKMTPLREDHPEDTIPPMRDDAMPDAPRDDADVPVVDPDATLEQLATEFAESQDTITDVPPSPQGGKIGKLKNILPFKKAKREDPGLMGDLFGWAGIAANDDEFSIPGFFTNAAAKK
ncbi:hypothetical protein HDR63_01335 [bacterium]|nr:hypothetical protein [bacterium]